MPQFVNDINTPNEVGVLAADHRTKSLIELEGQLEGFQYVDLDKEGLSEYRSYLSNLGIKDLRAQQAEAEAAAASVPAQSYASASASAAASNAAAKIFAMIDSDSSGTISVNEAERIVLRLNSRLQRAYGENDVKAFFYSMTGNNDSITRDEFITAFQRIVQ